MKIPTILASLALVFTVGCGDVGGHAHDDAAVVQDGGVDAAPDASCFTNPQTHNEIINACTTADKIYKDSHPPLLDPDGSLPPLP
jgi:hypothetical protein